MEKAKTYEEKKDSVLSQYFKQYLDHIYPAIELYNDLARQYKDGILNVMHTMFLCSVIDHFGKIMRVGSLGNDDPIGQGQTAANFEFFIENYFPPNERCKGDIIYKLFRNGVMHQFFPKASGGFWSNDYENHKWLLEEDGEFPKLNNFVLSNYIGVGLRDIMHKFENDRFVSYIENIHTNLVLNNYGFDDHKVLKKLREKYKEKGKTFYEPCEYEESNSA